MPMNRFWYRFWDFRSGMLGSMILGTIIGIPAFLFPLYFTQIWIGGAVIIVTIILCNFIFGDP